MLVLYRLVALAALLLLWWLAARAAPGWIPTPLATAEAGRAMLADGTIAKATGESLAVYAVGYLLAAVVGIAAGLFMGGFRLLGRTLEVYVNALAATPRVSFIPLIIVLLGIGFEAKVAVIFLGAVMPVVLNTYAGVLQADGELVEMARSAGASRAQIFRRILLPGALPYVVVGSASARRSASSIPSSPSSTPPSAASAACSRSTATPSGWRPTSSSCWCWR